MSKMKRRLLIAGIGLAALVTLLGPSVGLWGRNSEAALDGRTESARVGEPGLGAIHWPDSWARAPVQEGDEAAGILLRLRRAEPDAAFLLRRITGKLERPFNLDDLARESEAALQEGVQDFAAIDNRQVNRGGVDVVSIEYVQGESGNRFRAQLLIIPRAERTFYLTFRVAASRFAELEREFEMIADGFLEAL